MPFADDEVALAHQSGEPVVVEELTTELSQTTANPNGTFTYSTSIDPVRIQRDGTWILVDTTLVAGPDGTIAPAAAPLDVTFSAGGDAPFATLANDTQTLALSWPVTLPVPVLEGNTATYLDVMPGVDLQVAAGANSFHQTLIVKSAEAAANPALHEFDIQYTVTGLELDSTSDGLVDLVDPVTGEAVFGSHPAVMWDSAVDPNTGPAPTAIDPGGAQTADIATQIEISADQSAATVTLEPALSALVGDDIQYPVYIDPTINRTSPSEYGFVFTNGWNSHNNPSNDLKVGNCGGWPGCDGIGTGRSFIGFDVSEVSAHGSPTPIHVASASVRVKQIHQAQHCGPTDVDLQTTNGPFTASTTWNTALANAHLGRRSSSAGSCPGHPAYEWLNFNDSAITDYVQAGIRAGNNRATFALVSANEQDNRFWKRFGSTGPDAPTLDFVYGFPPSSAAASGINDSYHCGGTLYANLINETTTRSLTLRGLVRDNNPNWPGMHGLIEVWQNGTNNRLWASPYLSVTAYTEFSHTFTGIPDGTYQYSVKAYVPGMPDTWSASSSRLTFTVATQRPANPTVASFHYPKPLADNLGAFWGAPKNSPGVITFDDAGAQGVVGFVYGWDSESNIPIPNSTDCGNYDKTFGNTAGFRSANADGKVFFSPPASMPPGPHKLYVKSFNGAQRLSYSAAVYDIFISPSMVNLGTWTFEAEDPMRAPVGPASGTLGIWNTSLASGGQARTMNGWSGHPDDGPEFSFNVQVSATTYYAIGANMIKASSSGKLAFAVQNSEGTFPIIDLDTGNPVEVDLYRPASQGNIAAFHPIGGMRLQTGTNKIIVKVIGKNAASSGYGATIDLFQVIPIGPVTLESFTAGFNNDAISTGNPAGNIGPSINNTSMPTTAFSSPVFAGITFPMGPSYTGDDNIIAIGQTVPLPNGPATGKNLHLLVNATCGRVMASSQVRITINHDAAGTTNDRYQNFQIPPIPDFRAAPPTPAQLATAPYRMPTGRADDNGQPIYSSLAIGKQISSLYTAGATSAVTTTMYVLTIPIVFSDRPVTSITLPLTGTDLTNACTLSTLHLYSAKVTP